MAALTQVAGELEARGNQAGGEAEEILKAQALMAEDPGLVVKVRSLIDRGLAAPRAVFEAFTKYRTVLRGPADTWASGPATWATSGTA
ncbi:phosphoenolpyruvate-utilizing N-terminal domain-containing protein [Nonomuraea rubra]|uniref:phosphoenolpyruvate-utilizing N-terminal domain-containing protein n=1 Tax=Nonomuraea rubra TaxID=46180 RepID=UPI003610BF5A